METQEVAVGGEYFGLNFLVLTLGNKMISIVHNFIYFI